MVSRSLLAVTLVAITFAPRVVRANDLEDPSVRGSKPDPNWDLGASLSGRRYAIQSNSPGSRAIDGTAEALGLELVRFLVPLRDDGAPYTLQPFLQRMNTFSVSVDAGHFTTNEPTGDRTDWEGGVGAGVDLYAQRWLNIAASLSYSYDVLHDLGADEKTHTFSGTGGAGWRTGDTLVRVSYYVTKAQISDASAPLRQGVQLSASTVLARRLTLALFAETIPQGGEAQLSGEYFHGRNLGIFASALGAEGQIYRTGPAVHRFVGTVGVAGWLDSRTALLAWYTLRLEEQTGLVALSPTDILGNHETSHTLLVQLRRRFQ